MEIRKRNKCFGYAIYSATTLYEGTIIKNKITWEKN